MNCYLYVKRKHEDTADVLLTSCSMQAAARSATTRLGFIKTSSLYSEPKATWRAEKTQVSNKYGTWSTDN